MRKYNVNPCCPKCGEEHNWYRVELTEEEQQEMDSYYEERKAKRQKQTTIANLIDDTYNPPLKVKRQFKCGACGHEFEAIVGICEYDEVGYRNPNMIPMGEYPVW